MAGAARRRLTAAVVAGLGVVALAGCGLSPVPAPSRDRVLTRAQVGHLTFVSGDPQIAAVHGVLDDGRSGGQGADTSTVSSYAKMMLPKRPVFSPVVCGDSSFNIILASDVEASGTVFTGGSVLLEAGASNTVVDVVQQQARYFPTASQAAAWMTRARQAKAACPDFTVGTDPGPTTVRQVTSDGGLPIDSFKQHLRVEKVGDTQVQHLEVWTLREENAVVTIAGGTDTAGGRNAIVVLTTSELRRLAAARVAAQG